MNFRKISSKLQLIIALHFILFKGYFGQVIWRDIFCQTADENYAKFEYCELRENKDDGVKSLSLYLRLLQLPITNIKFQIAFTFSTMATPIDFNTTWDACEFMANRKRFKALAKFYNMVSRYTNVNHTCPYNHDMFVTNLGSMETELNIHLISGVVNFRTAMITDGKVRVIVRGVANYNAKKKTHKLVKGKNKHKSLY